MSTSTNERDQLERLRFVEDLAKRWSEIPTPATLAPADVLPQHRVVRLGRLLVAIHERIAAGGKVSRHDIAKLREAAALAGLHG